MGVWLGFARWYSEPPQRPATSRVPKRWLLSWTTSSLWSAHRSNAGGRAGSSGTDVDAASRPVVPGRWWCPDGRADAPGLGQTGAGSVPSRTVSARSRRGRSTVQSAAATVDEYVAGVDGPWLPVVERLRDLCRERLPGYDEVIAYGMPTYQLDGRTEVGFARQAPRP